MDPRAFLVLFGVVLLLSGIVSWGQIPGSLPPVMTLLGAVFTFLGVATILRM